MNTVHRELSAVETDRITTIVVDDSPSFMHGFCHYLRTEPNTEVIGTGHNGFEAIDLVGRLRPQLVVMDFHMPGLPGDRAAVWIVEHFPETHVLMISSDEQPEVSLHSWARCAFMCKCDLMSEFVPLLERWFPRGS